MFTVRTDESFFDQFRELQLKVLELSCLFQNNNTQASTIELKEWNNIAYKLQNDLSSLIKEANERFE